ncbi:MAG: cytochrome c3 family protein [Thermodesulfobacteriota bacterium]
MRKFATLMAIVLVTVFSAGWVVAADPPEKITIKAVQKLKPPVEFPHKEHAGRLKCAECHHKDAAGKEQSCFACHKAEKKGEAIPFKDAMHGKCQACHKKVAKGPTKCNDCHKQ